MPIGEQTPISAHTGNGVAVTFAYDFGILALDDLKVRVDGVDVTTGFTVSGVGDRSGGTVAFTVPPGAGVEVLIYRDVSRSRTTDYQNNGDLREDVLDADFDRLWMAIQEDGEQIARSIRVPVGETMGELPATAARANMFLGFDATGALALVSSPELGGMSSLIVGDGSISTAKLAAGAVTAPKMAADAVAARVALDGGLDLPGDAATPLQAMPLQQSMGRNRVVNSSMRIDQEFAGASTTITAGAALLYVLDQWYAYCTGANTTAQQIALANGKNRLRITGASSNTGLGIGQRIEAIDTLDLAGGQATIQAKLSSSSLVTVGWALYYANTKDTFGTLASPTRTLISSGSWSIGTTEATKTATVSIPSAAITGLELVITAGPLLSGQTLTVGDVQIEAGPVATAFERVPLSADLARCYRFAYIANRTVYVGGYAAAAGTVAYVNVQTPVEMRTTTPVFALALGTNNNVSVANAQGTTRWGTNLFAQAAAAGNFSMEFPGIKFTSRL